MECTDQMGRTVLLKAIPTRIVSVVPSQTELLFDLGAGGRVGGVTRFCIHPEDARRQKTTVGGTKNLKQEVIRQINPDLIIANKEENTREQVEKLMIDYPVWISDIHNLEDATNMIGSIGRIVNAETAAAGIISRIHTGFNQMEPLPLVPALYLIWRNPWMSIGKDTFIHHIMERCGLQNVCAHQSRYPLLTETEMQALNPSVVILSSEPYPFKEKHLAEIQAILPHARVILADGEMFSWYGSRLAKAGNYLRELTDKLRRL